MLLHFKINGKVVTAKIFHDFNNPENTLRLKILDGGSEFNYYIMFYKSKSTWVCNDTEFEKKYPQINDQIIEMLNEYFPNMN